MELNRLPDGTAFRLALSKRLGRLIHKGPGAATVEWEGENTRTIRHHNLDGSVGEVTFREGPRRENISLATTVEEVP